MTADECFLITWNKEEAYAASSIISQFKLLLPRLGTAGNSFNYTWLPDWDAPLLLTDHRLRGRQLNLYTLALDLHHRDNKSFITNSYCVILLDGWEQAKNPTTLEKLVQEPTLMKSHILPIGYWQKSMERVHWLYPEEIAFDVDEPFLMLRQPNPPQVTYKPKKEPDTTLEEMRLAALKPPSINTSYWTSIGDIDYQKLVEVAKNYHERIAKWRTSDDP